MDKFCHFFPFEVGESILFPLKTDLRAFYYFKQISDGCEEREEAIRCLSAAIFRYTNKHSSELTRNQNGSETDELLGRVASRSSKVSVGRRSAGSRCSSRCSRETCRRFSKNNISSPEENISSRQNASTYSSPMSVTQSKMTPNYAYETPPSVFQLGPSAFQSVPIREDLSWKESNNKNRMADFWEKSIQAASQVNKTES